MSCHFFLEGLSKLLIARDVLRFREENGITDDVWEEMVAYAGEVLG